MTSSPTVRSIIIGACALAFVSSVMVRNSLAAAAPAHSQPNIVFIMADDMGYADLRSSGRRDVQTPGIDRLAAEGMRLRQAYANSAVCSASRTALMTGRYQYRLRIGLEEPLAANPDVGLPPGIPTLPSLLRKAGYATVLIGKWHLGAYPKFGPLQSGYDHFFGMRTGAVDYFTHHDPAHRPDLWEDDKPVQMDGYLTDLLGERAVRTIEQYAASRRPFLLSLHFNAPHWPWEGPKDRAESERLRGGDLFDFDGGTQATYQAMLEAMDSQVSDVLKALDRTGIADNTIVVFTSDNGGERYADTWPFTGRKTELLEGGIRVPALIRWPGHIRAGSTSGQVTMTMDWLPTLLAAAGGAPDPTAPPDGINILPQLTTGAAEVHRTLFWRYKGNAQHAVRDGDYKYLKILDNTFLFNVAADPMERANLKKREAATYRNLTGQWRAWNRTMLPEVAESYTDNFTGAQLADHIGTPPTSKAPDNGDD